MDLEKEMEMMTVKHYNPGVSAFFTLATILLLACAPALVWAIYGWAF